MKADEKEPVQEEESEDDPFEQSVIIDLLASEFFGLFPYAEMDALH
jgi:hypothetical protein